MEVVLDVVEEGERLKLVTMTMISNILSEDTTEVLAMAWENFFMAIILTAFCHVATLGLAVNMEILKGMNHINLRMNFP